MIAAFLISLTLLGYTYLGYPLLMRLASRKHRRNPAVAEPVELPSVTVIVPARNEAAAIGAKVANVLELDYPHHRLELIVVSDASTDGTDTVVGGVSDKRVRLLRLSQHGGKVAALRAGVGAATGSILAFSDATGRLDRASLRSLVARFSDPAVGAVTGRVLFEPTGRGGAVGEGERTYWSYNSSLLQAESDLASVTSLSGTFFAVRAGLFPIDMPEDLAEDLVVPLTVVDKGRRAVLEPRAVCREEAVADEGQELRKRARITLQNIRGLVWGKRMLNPFRHGRFALFLISHKMLRILAPVLLVVAAFCNLLLLGRHWFFTASALGQASFYAVGALAGPLRLRRFGAANAIHFFCLSNLGVAIGIVRFIGGRRATRWETERGGSAAEPGGIDQTAPAGDEQGG